MTHRPRALRVTTRKRPAKWTPGRAVLVGLGERYLAAAPTLPEVPTP